MKPFAFAFLFDANHPELGSIYGPPCTSKVITALEASIFEINTRVLRGDLLPHLLAYQIASVSTEKSIGGARVISHSQVPNLDLYKTILCDIAESFEHQWCTVNTVTLPFVLAEKTVWSIVLPTITQDVAEEINTAISSFRPYLGATIIDTGNPIHMAIFSLIDKAHFKNKTLYFCCDPDECDTEEAIYIARSYGSNKDPVIVDPEAFNKDSPPPLISTKLTKRGNISAERLEGKSRPSHGQKLARELLDFLHENPDVDGVFYSAEISREEEDFICDENKIKNYLLNIEHPDGGPKAKFFIETLGIQREDWRYLADQISGAMRSALIYRLKNSAHGINHGAYIKIRGRNGRTAVIQTGWMIKSGENARLVTAYPHSGDLNERLEAPPENISPLEIDGADRWKDIYERADAAGMKAAADCVPTPMTLSDCPPIFEGKCGYAWVTIFDARTGMGKWLKDNNIGRKNFRAGWDIPANPTPHKGASWDFQSLEPKVAYANAFAKVLLSNGVKCHAESRLD